MTTSGVRRGGAAGFLAAVAAMLLPAVGCVAGSVDDLSLEENPNNPLSVIVGWSTAEEATSRVECACPGRTLVVDDEELVREHEELVIGLRPDETCQVRVTSTTAGGVLLEAEPREATAGSLPVDGLVAELTVRDPDAMEPGWTLTNVVVGEATAEVLAVMFDDEGYPVWSWRSAARARADVVMTLVDGDKVLIGGALDMGGHPVMVDLAGEVVWQGPTQPASPDRFEPGTMHHEFVQAEDGDFVTLRYEEAGAGLTDGIDVMDEDGRITWSWIASDHVEEAQGHYLWGNAALVDGAAGIAYYHGHDCDTLYKIDMATGDVLWRLGPDGDFEPDPDADHPWVEHGHAPEIEPDGHILMYDNGFDRDFSRVVEMEIDEQAMTARIAWEYPGEIADDRWSTFHLGDADRLANGNTLVTACTFLPEDTTSHLFEVTAAGDKVWELTLEGGQGAPVGCYRAERIPALVDVQ